MVGAVLTTVGIFTAANGSRLYRCNWPSGSGSPCCSPILRKPWPKAAAKPRPKVCGRRAKNRWRGGCARWKQRGDRSRQLQKGDLVVCEAGDVIPADGEVIEGIASVDEVGDHRRIRPGHSRERRRPQRGHRRHARAISDRIVIRVTMEKGTVSGPDDRDGGRRETAEDAERNRADHSALGADVHFPAGVRHAETISASIPAWIFPIPVLIALAGLPDSDDDWRPAERHWHQRAWTA